jgi:hypothetical protein
MPISRTSENHPAATIVGSVVGGICVGSIWGYLSQSMGFSAIILLRYVLFTTGSYLVVALLMLFFFRRSRLPIHLVVAGLGSITFVLTMYFVDAFPDVWRFRQSTGTSAITYFLNEAKDLAMPLLLHAIIDGVIVLLILTLTGYIASVVYDIAHRDRNA